MVNASPRILHFLQRKSTLAGDSSKNGKDFGIGSYPEVSAGPMMRLCRFLESFVRFIAAAVILMVQGIRNDGEANQRPRKKAFPTKAETMRMRRFSTGEPVVFEEVQRSMEAENSEGIVVHYMTVMESREKGTLVLLTQSGQLHVTHNNNPSLRRASWWERLRHPGRFPRLSLTQVRQS